MTATGRQDLTDTLSPPAPGSTPDCSYLCCGSSPKASPSPSRTGHGQRPD